MIFIVGNSRSGTTLMAQILSRHADIYILHETHFMEEFSHEKDCFDSLSSYEIRKLINRFFVIQHKGYYRKNEFEEYPQTDQILKNLEKSNQLTFPRLIDYLFKHEASKHGKSIPGDQTPRHIFYINELLTMFPQAKFINMIRDPRAVLLSQKFKWKAGLRKGVPIFETIRTFFNYHPILMSYIWNKGIKSSLSLENKLKKGTLINVKFEDLTNNPKKTIRKICNFLNINFTEAMLDVTVSMSSTNTDEGKKGISKNVADKWVNNLSSTEIYLSEKTNRELIHVLEYPLLDKNPNLLKLLFYLLILPFQSVIIFVLNRNRMGNPINFIKKRLK